jgi:hypothetical protein
MVRKILVPFLLAVISTLFINDLEAVPRKRIAILGFRANNVTKPYADVVRDILEVTLYKTNAFEILERYQMDIILKERGLDKTTCSDKDCAIELGKLLSVDFVVVGSVNKLGKFTITLKFVNVKEAKLEYADSEIAQIEEVIEKAVNDLAERSVKNLLNMGSEQKQGSEAEKKGKAAQSKGSEHIGYYLRGIVPGWGQIYADHTVKGTVIAGLFALSTAWLGYTIYDFTDKRKSYESLTPAYPKNEYDSRYKASEKAYIRMGIALGLFAGIYIYNWVDILFISTPKAGSNAIREGSVYFYAGGNRHFEEGIYNAGVGVRF